MKSRIRLFKGRNSIPSLSLPSTAIKMAFESTVVCYTEPDLPTRTEPKPNSKPRMKIYTTSAATPRHAFFAFLLIRSNVPD
jgi:hypothetical protein